MRLNRTAVAFTAAVSLIAFMRPGLAGTTGGIAGRTIDSASSAPVVAAAVTVVSPSQTATTTSDANGHFSFISLAPDTYILTGSKSGYKTQNLPGVTVIADQTRTVTLSMEVLVRTLGV